MLKNMKFFNCGKNIIHSEVNDGRSFNYFYQSHDKKNV